MQKARYLIAMSCACASAACGTEVATAVYPAKLDAGPPGLPEKPPPCNSSRLTSRLLFGQVKLPEPVRYKRASSYFGFPQDDRIAFSTSNNGTTMVAWLNSSGTQVHVTPVVPPELNRIGDNRAGEDRLVDGTELSGFVALDDGFALLTRRPDPGELLDGVVQQATFLVRWQNGRQRFAVPLTGTNSITDAVDNEKRDYPLGASTIGLSGRLVFDGTQYGAYFAVRGGTGGGISDRYVGSNGDKFVQVDDSGQFVASWRAACRQNLGGRLVADQGGFVPVCMSDGFVGTAGVYVALGARSARRLAPEVTFSSGGYSGGNLGSVVKVTDGYLVAWASRGVASSGGAGHDSHEPAVALVTKDLNLAAAPKWPFLIDPDPEPLQDAVNVHASPYGDNVLIVWETIESPQYRPSTGVSMGAYGGTHFRLVDASGKQASIEEMVPDNFAPNGQDDIVEFPNHDLGWAYVPEDRRFDAFIAPSAAPPVYEIKLVKLQYCIP